jgi:hypothetical protein
LSGDIPEKDGTVSLLGQKSGSQIPLLLNRHNSASFFHPSEITVIVNYNGIEY